MKRFVKPAIAILLVVLLLATPALAAPAACNVFYPQLSNMGKSLYNAYNDSSVLYNIYSGQSFSFTFDGPFSDANATANAISAADTQAFAAFEIDHPEIFWLSGTRTNVTGDTYQLELKVVPQFYWNWNGGGRNVFDDVKTLESAVQKLAAEAKREGDLTDQLFYLYYWLTENNEYNSYAAGNDGMADRLPWSPLAALTDVASPVCMGYATAFKLVCDELGIPCLVVYGQGNNGTEWGGHAWNQVYLDGKWYGVDPTYGDTDDDEVADFSYFLAGSNTYGRNGMTFGESHKADGSKLQGVTFTYPDLAAEENEAYGDDEPTYPGGGSSVGRQDIPAEGTAYVSTQTITLGAKQITLPAYKLLNEEGNPTNYVRLRDLASLLNGTDAEFDVIWNAETGIGILSCTPYEHPNGTEGKIPFTGDQPYKVYLSDTLVDGESMPLTAFQITWEGGGHTYYQLRDLGRALNFNVGWSGTRGIYIEPDKPYTEAD